MFTERDRARCRSSGAADAVGGDPDHPRNADGRGPERRLEHAQPGHRSEAAGWNKPGRPIPSGRVTEAEALRLAGWLYVAAFVLAAFVGPQCTLLAGTAAVFTVLYSAPPFRLKAVPYLANVVIAIPRGVLLKVAGWSCVRDFGRLEPWYIGAIFGLFLLGATTTKDFADIRGDAEAGFRTLPVVHGPKRAAWMITPFLVLPFLLIPYGVHQGYLTGHPWVLYTLTAVLCAWGLYVAYLMVRRPDDLARTENIRPGHTCT
jgi:4-hydroxybenzoate polyprenyltransferase